MQRSWLTRAGGWLWAVTGRGPSAERLQLSPPRIFSTNPPTMLVYSSAPCTLAPVPNECNRRILISTFEMTMRIAAIVAMSALSVLIILLAMGELEVTFNWKKTPPTRTPLGQPVEQGGSYDMRAGEGDVAATTRGQGNRPAGQGVPVITANFLHLLR